MRKNYARNYFIWLIIISGSQGYPVTLMEQGSIYAII